MTHKIARSTCQNCHRILPRTEMQLFTFEEPAGSSFGVSGTPGRKNSKARLSRRTYKRTRKAWICNSCAVPINKEIKTVQLFKLGIFVAIFTWFLFTNLS